jgi:hypothetical protein
LRGNTDKRDHLARAESARPGGRHGSSQACGLKIDTSQCNKRDEYFTAELEAGDWLD